ncbi:uncharacterized protein EDB91DRAFT_138672 [Suillus paluster]|uniref:uncharacterized protein n=1 Tax=Suillus paluster TaxID=48578 RepID=UPI001B868B04|nr:uncharacterized protein EDB91DRAFT_138672 [Suillus paluster]KAG1746023.1 hypothetical protein EDB91DRAFT_138672 [Suillus paluster]
MTLPVCPDDDRHTLTMDCILAFNLSSSANTNDDCCNAICHSICKQMWYWVKANIQAKHRLWESLQFCPLQLFRSRWSKYVNVEDRHAHAWPPVLCGRRVTSTSSLNSIGSQYLCDCGRRLNCNLQLCTSRQKNMKPKAEFQSLAEELQCFILTFLPYRDVLRCTSVSYNLQIDDPVLDGTLY